MNAAPDLFADYPGGSADEAVDGNGRLRGPYAVLGPVLERLGGAGLADVGAALVRRQQEQGVTWGAWVDGVQHLRPRLLDPVPRVIAAADRAALAEGMAQRHRALNAFLADAYRAAGRRRSDPDRAPEIVRAGLLPEWAVVRSPAHDPDAVGMAWPGQPRAGLAAADLVRSADGTWTVLADDLQVPAGLGYAVAARDSVRAAAPALLPDGGAGLADPREAVRLLGQALADAAPPACVGEPRLAVLTSGENDAAWSEHRILAAELVAPLVHPADLWPRADGGIAAAVGGARTAVDVIYRRTGDGELAAHATPTGQSLESLLAESVRAGRLGLLNVPGNGLADDRATYAHVPAMIRFYLGEEPLLASPATWVLADERQWAQVRDRLHELVVKPLGGYGGQGLVVGPDCSAAELAQLQAEVAAAPHRFVAQELVEVATMPAVDDGRLVPRRVDLRIFSVASRSGVRLLPAAITGVARGGGDPAAGTLTKDTWLLG